MANEEKKDFNAMLKRDNGMPKIQVIDDERSIKKYGGSRMYFAPPAHYDLIMKQVPEGMVTTVGEQRKLYDKAPYHRTLKAGGELNPKYPGGVEAQKTLLEAEGHTIIKRGRTNIRYYVQDFEKVLYSGFESINRED